MPRTLGAAIRDRRAELGWTQEDLAVRANGIAGEGEPDYREWMRQSDVSRLERGKVGLPRRQRLERIAAALGLPLGELLARSGWSGAAAAFAGPASGPADGPPPPAADRGDPVGPAGAVTRRRQVQAGGPTRTRRRRDVHAFNRSNR